MQLFIFPWAFRLKFIHFWSEHHDLPQILIASFSSSSLILPFLRFPHSALPLIQSYLHRRQSFFQGLCFLTLFFRPYRLCFITLRVFYFVAFFRSNSEFLWVCTRTCVRFRSIFKTDLPFLCQSGFLILRFSSNVLWWECTFSFQYRFEYCLLIVV